MTLSTEEARLVGLHREVKRFMEDEDPRLVDTLEVSAIASYLEAIVNLKRLEKDLTEGELSNFLYGVISGVAVNRLINSELTLEQYSNKDQQQPKGFVEQTGVDKEGNIRR